jgi:hypothetical protein
MTLQTVRHERNERPQFIIRNADGSEWIRVLYRDMAEGIVKRNKSDGWLVNQNLLPQTIEQVQP